MEEKLRSRCADLMHQLEEAFIELNEFRDRQWVMDLCDRLNQLSIKY